MKRGTTDLCLVLAVDKPSGMTSHDVVSRARRIFGEKRIGHTGTLDPLASGVLPLCVGPATRLDQFLTGHDKSYVVSVVFGAATDTDDCDGEVIRTGVVPDEVFDPFFASVFVGGLVGKSKQLPPVYSAIKVGGTKACDAARKGRVIDLAPRDIEVYSAELLGIGGADGAEPARWDIAFKVSKGTYIRALARDLGKELGVGGYLTRLRRTRVGRFALPDDASGLIAPEAMLDTRTHTVTAHTDQKTFTNREGQTVTRNKCVLDTPEGLAGDERRNWLLDHALTMEQAARGAMPALDITPEEASELRFGRRIERTISEPTAAIVPQTHDVAAIIERANAHQAKPVTVFPLA